jgi:hypothetical protein
MFCFDYININPYSCDDAESDNVFSDSSSDCWQIISEENNFIGGFNEEDSVLNLNSRPYLEIENNVSKNLRDETNSKQPCFENSLQNSSQSKDFIEIPDSGDFMKALSNKYLCRNPECLHDRKTNSVYCSDYCSTHVANIHRPKPTVSWNQKLIKSRKLLLEFDKTKIFEIKRKQLLEEYYDREKEKLKLKPKEKKEKLKLKPKEKKEKLKKKEERLKI